MDSIMIWLSIGIFLLFPYYLSVFSFNRKYLRCHMVFWLCLHLVSSIIFGVMEQNIWNVPLILFCAYSLYFLFSYLFYVRDMFSKQEEANLREILNSRWTPVILTVSVGVSTLLLMIDEYLLIRNIVKAGVDWEYLYLAGVVVISYIQIIFSIKKYWRNS